MKPYFAKMTRQIPRIKYLAFLLIYTAMPAFADESSFPQPAELQRDVDFWVSIFTRYSTSEGVLHDNRNLSIVYERTDMPSSLSRKERNRRAEKRRNHYEAILRKLANGKRSGLSTEEKRVLALWPDNITNEELRAAIGQIRFQMGLSDRFREGFIRSGRWRPFVNAEFSKLGVPIELAALPHVESSYNPDARSHIGASGIWQFTRGTGRRFMQVDHVLDERNDPFLATQAAAKLLAYNYSITGNWPMAITAYNHGLSGVRRAMHEFGDQEYTKILREYQGRTFGFASRNFYVAFLAAKEVDQNIEKYFPGLVPEAPVDYQQYVLKDYAPIGTIADALGISEGELGNYNPALQATVFQGSKYLPRDYEVRVPSRYLDKPIDELMANVPTESWFSKQLPDLFHTVARGDTLSQIADAYGTRVSTLAELNNLGSKYLIRVGQQLRLPAAGPMPTIVASTAAQKTPDVIVAEMTPVDEVPIIVASLDEEPEEVSAMTDVLTPPEPGSIQSSLLSDPSDYTVADDESIEVHPLETLGHYADWLGIKTQRLRDINGLAFQSPVEVGQRIRIDLSKVDSATFESIRSEFHRSLQDAFFRSHTISGINQHTVKKGESVWILSLRQYKVPIWLFRQYNPELDLHNVRPGTKINFPLLAERDGAAEAS